MKSSLLIFLLLAFTSSSPCFASTILDDLTTAINKQQWNNAAEMAYEIVLKGPSAGINEARLKGAYALFQKGYSSDSEGVIVPLRVLVNDKYVRMVPVL